MQISDKEAVKRLPPEDFLINNLSKKAMLALAQQMGAPMNASASKTAAARQVAQLYRYFPAKLALLLDETAKTCFAAMLANDCEGAVDEAGVDTLVRLGIAQILIHGEERLAVVPRAFLDSAALR